MKNFLNLCKNIALLSVFVFLAVAISACSQNSQSYTPTSYTASELPYEMDFSGTVVPIEKVTFFEEYADHSYTPYIVMVLNRENLTDDDIHWMTKYDTDKIGREIDINAYVDSEENELDLSRLNSLGAIYNENYLYYFFFGDQSRYSYNGSEFNFQIIHVPTKLTASDTVYYYYDVTIDSTNYANSDEALTENERSAFYQAIENYVD